MDLKTCYEIMEGDYEDVMRRLGTEERVKKFLVKLLEEKSFDILLEAISGKDYETAFRAAHSLKGICMNFALTKLLASSSAMTEYLRSGDPGPELENMKEQLESDYKTVIDTISNLLEE